MALLVHVTAEKNAAGIARAGIAAHSRSRSTRERGVFCTPLLSSYTLTYQWSRELLRRGDRTVVAVHFDLPDDTMAFVGHYGSTQAQVPLAEAVAGFRSAEDPRGWEIFLPRAVPPGAIRRIRTLTRPVGWRYFPGAHGRRPCSCPACLGRGEYGAAGIRRRFPLDPPLRPRNAVLAELAVPQTSAMTVELLEELAARRKGDAHRVAHLVDHPDPAVREALATLLKGGFRGGVAASLLNRLRTDAVEAVREAAED